jgi:hypothetical protein
MNKDESVSSLVARFLLLIFLPEVVLAGSASLLTFGLIRMSMNLAKVSDSLNLQKTMEKKADELNSYCDEIERELEEKKDSKLISKESEKKNDFVKGFKIHYSPMFSLPDNTNNDADTLQAGQRLNNMTLALPT